jgi:hypothetical protein
MCQGATQNYTGLLAARFFLGLSEAGYYPGVLYERKIRFLSHSLLMIGRYHLSFWYPADRLPLRVVRFSKVCLEISLLTHLLGILLRLRSVLGDHKWVVRYGLPRSIEKSCLLIWPQTAAYAISFMNRAGGLSGWRWVFILEGIPAILCGIYTYFFLPNCKHPHPI